MKTSRIIAISACCVFVGLALGVMLGRASKRDGTQESGGADAKVFSSGSQTARGVGGNTDGKGFPDLAHLTTPEQWRGYIEQWVKAECPESRQSNAFECLRLWSESDAEGALAFVHEAARFSKRNDAYAIPLAVIGAKDMTGVIGWLQKNLPENDRGGIAENLIGKLADTHPEKASMLAFADNIPVDPLFFGQIMQAMLKTNPADALRVLDGLSDNGKAQVAGDFAVAWLKLDEKATLEWCATQQGKPHGDRMCDDVLRYYARENPAGISEAIEKMGIKFDSDARHQFMYFLAHTSPLAALEVLQKMPPDRMGRYGAPVIIKMFETDADQAVAAANVLLSEGNRAQVLYRGYLQWVNSDRKAAEAWLASEADGALREQIKMRQAADENPSEFLASLGSHMDLSSSLMEECVSNALFEVSHKQPVEALRWLLENPDQITKDRLNHLRYPGDTDGQTLLSSAAISSVPEGMERDAVIDFAANSSIWRQDWSAAAGLLPLVTDSGKQDALRFKIFTRMMDNPSEREAAREWLATQPLSEEVRASWETLAGSGIND